METITITIVNQDLTLPKEEIKKFKTICDIVEDTGSNNVELFLPYEIDAKLLKQVIMGDVEYDDLETIIGIIVCNDYLGINIDDNDILNLEIGPEDLDILVGLFGKYRLPAINELIHKYFSDMMGELYEAHPQLKKRRFKAIFEIYFSDIIIYADHGDIATHFKTIPYSETHLHPYGQPLYSWYIATEYQGYVNFWNPKGMKVISIPKSDHKYLITPDWMHLVIFDGDNKIYCAEINKLELIDADKNVYNYEKKFICRLRPDEIYDMGIYGEYLIFHNHNEIFIWDIKDLDTDPTIIKLNIIDHVHDKYCRKHKCMKPIELKYSRDDKSIAFVVDGTLFKYNIITLECKTSNNQDDIDKHDEKDSVSFIIELDD